MAQQYEHEDVSTVPRGFKVRTGTLPGGTKVRLAFPPGRRQEGAGQLVSILHPNRAGPEMQRRNPVKTKTYEQVERMKEKAVKFLRDIAHDADKAEEIAGLSTSEYAEKKHITISNPRTKRKGKSRATRPKARNQADETAGAIDVFTLFHGKVPTEIILVQEDDLGRDTYSALGELYDMSLFWEGENYKLDFEGNGVKLCSSADKRQLYCVGGDQNCDQALPSGAPDKDIVILGVLRKISYVTRKRFDGFKESAYEHKFGEEGGEPPIAFYGRNVKRVFMAGGTYQVEAPGIID